MNNLLKKINTLYNNNSDETIYNLIIKQLIHNSNDIELWISLARVIVAPPIVDYETSIACINKALAIDQNNVVALLLLAHVYEYELGGINDTLLQKIETLDSSSAELNSMLKYTASWSYSLNRKNQPLIEENLLKESITLYSQHVWNYVHLAKLYLRQGHKTKAYDLINKALNNIQKIYTDNDLHDYDITNIDNFLKERIQGIYLTDNNVCTIQKMFLSK